MRRGATGVRRAREPRDAIRTRHYSYRTQEAYVGWIKIMTGLRRGAAYCFDEQAYNRFLPLAQMEGLSLGPEDFSDPGPHGVHLLRVQWLATV